MSDSRPASARLGDLFAALHRRELPLVVAACRLQSRQRWVRRLMVVATRGGDGWALAAIVPLGFLLEPVRAQVALAAGVVSGVATALFVHFVKTLLRRRRPEGEGVTPPIGAPDRWAFPSGHTSHSFSVFVVLLWLHPALGLAMLPFSALVGASRIFLGLHYPSDVGAGVLIGSGFAAGVLGTLQATGSVDWIIRMGPLG